MADLSAPQNRATSNDVLAVAEQWLQQGRACALATVIETWGSAPRPIGSHLLIDADGNFEGSVSGGCVEGEVVTEAMDTIEDGTARLLEFGVADETAWRVGLSCGGRITVRVEALSSPDWLAQLNAARTSRRGAVLVTDIARGTTTVFTEDALPSDGALQDEIGARLRSAKSGRFQPDDGRDLFLNVHVPALRIIAVGAVHITQALAPMAKIAGYDLTVIDPRTAFATPERFTDVDLRAQWPEEALDKQPLDAHSAVIAVTHDPKIDDPALEAALKAHCFYIGALGSKKTHGRRVERLLEKGFSLESIDRIHAPIGLNIGAASPAEIAVAIMAEVILARRGAKA
ncbi:XdhC family protein [Pseudovibrio sp. SPO723]|uniref:XdhC family protein n=1 Tax=Nesiotobacter zosterae TaxID=392721 RepID=UPI0029C38007|nr:XdhC family protein [Pseudovibrio sp. SPO723]MDX5592109.1 XdhC family protein [Pseudovibrio sp. SPO723]